MLIMLDCSPSKISAYSEKYNYIFGQLRTPLTNYRWCERPYGIDNGCFTRFDESKFLRIVQQAKSSLPHPIFVTMPDIVGDAKLTLQLFKEWKPRLGPLSKALVLQDGIESHQIPWADIQAVFIGGSDDFKNSQNAINICKAAKILGKWVHVGRVNTPERVLRFAGIADSIDGSGISKYDHMLESVLRTIQELPPQQRVEIRHLFIAPPCESTGGNNTLRTEEIKSQGVLDLWSN